MGFFRRNNEAKQDKEPPANEEYMVEVQQDLTEKESQKRASKRKEHHPSLAGAVPTVDSDVNNDNETEIDPFRVEMDLTTYQMQSKNMGDDGAQAKRRCRMIVLALLAIILIAVVAVTLTLTLNNSNASPTADTNNSNSQTSPPASQTNDAASSYLLQALGFDTSSEVDAAFNEATPQGRAFASLLVAERLLSQTGSDRTPASMIVQRYALSVLFYSTSGPSEWINAVGWEDFTSTECDWNGVKDCRTGENGTSIVTKVELGSNNLKGTIPTEFCLLQDLVQIDLSNNLLSGNIPSCLTSFNSMEYLQLNNNMLTGTLPPLGLPNMIAADLSNNQLTGTLDLMFAATSILTNQTVLSVLRLDHNQFTGTVPALQSPGISVLTLSYNNMTGTVPFCPQQGSSSSQFETFEVDCTEVSCDCCTNCFTFCFSGNC